jgi:hypothetical protein
MIIQNRLLHVHVDRYCNHSMRSTRDPPHKHNQSRTAARRRRGAARERSTSREFHTLTQVISSDQVELKLFGLKGTRTHRGCAQDDESTGRRLAKAAASGRATHRAAPTAADRPVTGPRDDATRITYITHTHTRHSIPHRTDHTSILHRTTSHVVRIVYRLSRTDRSPHHKTIPYLTSGRSTTCITAPLR